MTFALAGAPAQSITLTVPGSRIWRARVKVAGPKTLAIGAAVKLTVGGLELAGAVHDGGTFAAQSEYIVVGGAGRWGREVKRRPYRSDGGVKLSTVLADLAMDAGERVKMDAPDRSLGYAFLRATGPASQALELIAPSWWMAGDGVTHVGTRPATTLPGRIKYRVQDYEPAHRRGLLGVADEDIGAFLPGVAIEVPEVGTVRIGTLTVRVSPKSVAVEVLCG